MEGLAREHREWASDALRIVCRKYGARAPQLIYIKNSNRNILCFWIDDKVTHYEDSTVFEDSAEVRQLWLDDMGGGVYEEENLVLTDWPLRVQTTHTDEPDILECKLNIPVLPTFLLNQNTKKFMIARGHGAPETISCVFVQHSGMSMEGMHVLCQNDDGDVAWHKITAVE